MAKKSGVPSKTGLGREFPSSNITSENRKKMFLGGYHEKKNYVTLMLKKIEKCPYMPFFMKNTSFLVKNMFIKIGTAETVPVQS